MRTNVEFMVMAAPPRKTAATRRLARPSSPIFLPVLADEVLEGDRRESVLRHQIAAVIMMVVQLVSVHIRLTRQQGET